MKIQSLIAILSVSALVAVAAPIPGQYIVQLTPTADAAQTATAYGVVPDHVYTTALNGFAGRIPAPVLARLQRDARVALIEPDVTVSIIGEPVLSVAAISASGEALPTGVARVNAHLNPRLDVSGVGMAVIDTGIALTHPDLNVAGGISYVRGVRSANDDNGHGSHCAGIAAAKADGSGVRGVAPNARLWAVKVLDKNGSGTLSAVLSGIDWVTKNAAAKGIRVANMSLGFQGTSSTLDSALNKSVTAGIVYVVAAGNSSADAGTFSPASNPNVITVSAMADTDGQCGGAGVATGYGADDTRATFSNYGSAVAIAAPGVNIFSTYKDNGYATLSGTSMAAPHVTGGIAQLLASQPTLTPANAKAVLQSKATAQSPVACWQDASGVWRGGFSGDVDAYAEPLLDVSGL